MATGSRKKNMSEAKMHLEFLNKRNKDLLQHKIIISNVKFPFSLLRGPSKLILNWPSSLYAFKAEKACSETTWQTGRNSI